MFIKILLIYNIHIIYNIDWRKKYTILYTWKHDVTLYKEKYKDK